LEDCPKGAGKGRFKNMGSSIGCRGQNSLEAESLRPNSPLGERINDDDDEYCFEVTVVLMFLSFFQRQSANQLKQMYRAMLFYSIEDNMQEFGRF